ncbi:uncharacterized protein LOC130799400 [Amaranthus tricolor]|uniref:uncharacterized protein LOC130799400 n=1 Tax=Amaranthus tricolor TaxID=29722 RepID=UPI00259047B9|nr:uncharacterized protein LOC130799400 [Amaranthus tricolor]
MVSFLKIYKSPSNSPIIVVVRATADGGGGSHAAFCLIVVVEKVIVVREAACVLVFTWVGAKNGGGWWRKTITRLWNDVKKQMTNKTTVINLNSKRGGREAANKIKFDEEKFKAIKYELKGTQHSVAKQMDVSQSTVCRWKRNKVIRRHTNAIKPTLNENNRLHRLSFALSKCEYDEQSDAFKFKPYTNVVHIDEKHFYPTRETLSYYLAPGEEPAKRSSKNRKKGELETKPIQSITKEHIRAMLITNMLPTIRAKWPAGLSKHIYIQQDNTKPHIAHNDREFLEEAMKDGFNIQLVQQPPNFPDMNVLDLELLRAVNNAFQNLSPQCLRFVFNTLQACMIEVMKRQGGFDYHIPHMNKTKAAREGTLPDYLSIDKQLVVDSLQHLFTKLSTEKMNQLVELIGYAGGIDQGDLNVELSENSNNQSQRISARAIEISI